MDKVRSMLNETGLDECYWAEAAFTAVYVINRSPNTSIQFDILEDKWTGHSLEYELEEFWLYCLLASSEGEDWL